MKINYIKVASEEHLTVKGSVTILTDETMDNPSLSNLNLLWYLARMVPTQLINGLSTEFVPRTWSVFNEFVTDWEAKVTVIGYGQQIQLL